MKKKNYIKINVDDIKIISTLQNRIHNLAMIDKDFEFEKYDKRIEEILDKITLGTLGTKKKKIIEKWIFENRFKIANLQFHSLDEKLKKIGYEIVLK